MVFIKIRDFPSLGFLQPQGGVYRCICPSYIHCLNNITHMIELVAENDGLGVITTVWTDTLLPSELTLYSLIATAEYCWSPKSITLEEFQERFLDQFFMCGESDILSAMYLISKKDPPLGYVCEDRSDLMARGQYADKETFKELLDKRIPRFCNDPKIGETISELHQMIDDAEKAAAILERSRKNVKKNRHTLDHMIFAARMLKHKARQALLFLDIEETLETKFKASSSCVKKLLRRLSALEKELKTLICEHRTLFEKTYWKSSVEKRIKTVFEGELEKVKEYREVLTG